jgi:uncharacterized membrane protein (UPF0127 family)
VTRPSAARLGAAAFAVVAVALLVFGIVRLVGGGDGSSSADAPGSSSALHTAVRNATPASAPFADLTSTRVTVGDRALHVVVADTESERETGLRRRSDVGPYDGMLFAFPSPTTVGFTMSTVPVALDIGFYDASGRVVDRLRMTPCAGTDQSCPVYRARGPFSYALETLAGRLPQGRLAAAP